jgi:hypothetical protein
MFRHSTTMNRVRFATRCDLLPVRLDTRSTANIGKLIRKNGAGDDDDEHSKMKSIKSVVL